MDSLAGDSLFTNMPLEETIEICTNQLFEESETAGGLSKTEFKELLSMATKSSNFVFDWTLYKQIVRVAMGSLLCPTLTNAFLGYYDKNWLERCPLKYRPLYYKKYVLKNMFLYLIHQNITNVSIVT